MTVVAIPHVVVREAIDVGVRPLVGIQVHVSNEELVQQIFHYTTHQAMMS